MYMKIKIKHLEIDKTNDINQNCTCFLLFIFYDELFFAYLKYFK